MSLTATENMDFVKDFFNNALEKGTSHAFIMKAWDQKKIQSIKDNG